MTNPIAAVSDAVLLNTWPLFDRFVATPFLGLGSKESARASWYAKHINERKPEITEELGVLRQNADSANEKDSKAAYISLIGLSSAVAQQKLVEGIDAQIARGGLWNMVPHEKRPPTIFDRGEVSIKEIGELGVRAVNNVAQGFLAKLNQKEITTTDVTAMQQSERQLKSYFLSSCDYAGSDPSKNDTIFVQIDKAAKAALQRSAHSQLNKLAENGLPWVKPNDDFYPNLVVSNVISAFQAAGEEIPGTTLREVGLNPDAIMSNGYAKFGLTRETAQQTAQKLRGKLLAPKPVG
ncbi:MAG: hypothetical protein WCD70_11150 [Alphaproteobacteria bacterium]